jgi:hypothetical protein
MSLNFSVTGRIQTNVESNQQSAVLDLGASLIYTQRADFERVYTGAVADDPVDLGTLNVGGARGILVKVTAGSATIKFVAGVTTGTLEWPLVPGAYMLYVNPSVGFPTGALVTTTAAASVKFIAVG